MTVFSVSSKEELMDALSQASGGDTISLSPGTYSGLELHGAKSPFLKSYDSPITITSSDPENPAVITDMRVHDVSNISFDGLEYNYSYMGGDAYREKPINVSQSENLSFVNSTFAGETMEGTGTWFDGFGSGIALWVTDSSNINVADNHFETYFRAGVFAGVDNVSVTGNEVTDMSSDGFNFTEVNHVLIEDNYLHNFSFNPESGAHMDMIQFWSAGRSEPSTDIVIRGNIMDSGGGDRTQAIFMRNEEVDRGRAGEEMYYRDILIENNVIHNAHLHGVSIGATDGLTIRHNTIVQNMGTDPDLGATTPSINAFGESYNVRIYNNISPADVKIESSADGNVARDNIRTQRDDPDAENYVQNVLIDGLGGEHTSLEDLQVVPGSIAEGAGAPITKFDAAPDEPIATIRMSEASVMEGDSLSFDASLSRGTDGFLTEGNATFVWTIHDAEGNEVHRHNGMTLDHTITTPGSYTAKLVVTQPDGKSATNVTQFDIGDRDVLAVSFADGTAADLSAYGANVKLGEHARIVEVDKVSVLKMTDKTNVSVDRGAHLFSHDSFTIEFGMQRDSAQSGTGDIFRIHTSQNIALRSDGELAYSMVNDAGERFNIITSGAGLSDTDWHHVAVTYDSVDQRANIYVDGQLVGSGEVTGTMKPMEAWGPSLGNPWHPGFNGYISHVSMTAEAIDSSESRALSNELHSTLSGTPIKDEEPTDQQDGSIDVDVDAAFAFGGDGVQGVDLKGQVSVASDQNRDAYLDLHGGYASFGKHEAFFDTSELSIFFDVKSDGVHDGTSRLLWNHMNYGIELVGSDTLRFTFFGGGRQAVEVEDAELGSGGWQNIGFALDTDTGAFTAYIDGQVVETANLANVEIREAQSWNVMFGGTPWGRGLDGGMDNLAVYHEFIDEDQARELYQNGHTDLLVA